MKEIKVLVVDDEELICQNVASKLSRLQHQTQYTVFTANDSDTAFSLFEEKKPDIVITDICMIGPSGLSLIERIRSRDKKTVILVLSGYDDFLYVRKAFLLEANDYLLKPLSIVELDEKLRQYVSLAHEPDEIPDVVELAKRYVRDNIGRRVSLSEVCGVVHMSYTYFSRLFKEREGVAFTQYAANERMLLARELLRDPRSKISAISKKLGFANPNQFSRAFKNAFGVYPTEYRIHKKDE